MRASVAACLVTLHRVACSSDSSQVAAQTPLVEQPTNHHSCSSHREAEEWGQVLAAKLPQPVAAVDCGSHSTRLLIASEDTELVRDIRVFDSHSFAIRD